MKKSYNELYADNENMFKCLMSGEMFPTQVKRTGYKTERIPWAQFYLSVYYTCTELLEIHT